MSRSLQINPIRALAVSGVLLGASLAPAPAHAQSVTPVRALLNTAPAGPSATPIAFLTRFSAFEPGASRSVDGETALLARVRAPMLPAERPRETGPTLVDGGRALLGRWGPTEVRRAVLSAESE